MTNNVGLCIVCKNKIPPGNKKYCSEKCYFKNQVDVARIKRAKGELEVVIIRNNQEFVS